MSCTRYPGGTHEASPRVSQASMSLAPRKQVSVASFQTSVSLARALRPALPQLAPSRAARQRAARSPQRALRGAPSFASQCPLRQGASRLPQRRCLCAARAAREPAALTRRAARAQAGGPLVGEPEKQDPKRQRPCPRRAPLRLPPQAAAAAARLAVQSARCVGSSGSGGGGSPKSPSDTTRPPRLMSILLSPRGRGAALRYCRKSRVRSASSMSSARRLITWQR